MQLSPHHTSTSTWDNQYNCVLVTQIHQQDTIKALGWLLSLTRCPTSWDCIMEYILCDSLTDDIGFTLTRSISLITRSVSIDSSNDSAVTRDTAEWIRLLQVEEANFTLIATTTCNVILALALASWLQHSHNKIAIGQLSATLLHLFGTIYLLTFTDMSHSTLLEEQNVRISFG